MIDGFGVSQRELDERAGAASSCSLRRQDVVTVSREYLILDD